MDGAKAVRPADLAAAVPDGYTPEACEIADFVGEAKADGDRITITGASKLSFEVVKGAADKKEENEKLARTYEDFARAVKDGGKKFRVAGRVGMKRDAAVALGSFAPVKDE